MICDGSVIPDNLGVNPTLSILAFSERAMSFIPARDGDERAIRWLIADERWKVKELLHRR